MNRIGECRKSMGLTMREAARRLTMPYTTYVNYEKGKREPNSETLINIAKFFDVSIDYLIGRSNTTGKDVPLGFQPIPETASVPRVGCVACGEPITAEENIERYDDVPLLWGSDFTLECRGDSMMPKIHDGDVVAIRKQDTVDNGEIAAVRIDCEATLKHVYLHSDYIELRPENPAYTSIIRRKEEMNDIHIEGKAVGLLRKI